MADPCEGALPVPARNFQARSAIGDGDSLCVGTTTDANKTWIEVGWLTSTPLSFMHQVEKLQRLHWRGSQWEKRSSVLPAKGRMIG